MTPERIEELREAIATATGGKWSVVPKADSRFVNIKTDKSQWFIAEEMILPVATAIVKSYEAVPELLTALETSEGVLKDTIEAMGHMQDEVAEWKRVAENNIQGMIGQKDIIDKQNGVLHRIRTLRDYAERDKCQIRIFDLDVALNCTVCSKNREECKC